MKTFQQPVFNKGFATPAITLTQPNAWTTNDGFQSGDLLARALKLRIAGALNLVDTGAGAVNALGALKNLRAITIKTDKHLNLVDNVDGVGLYRINQLMRASAGGESRDIAAATTGTPTFAASLEIPFYAPGLAFGLNQQKDSAGAVVSSAVDNFGNDSRLDMFKSRMSLIAQFGIVTDFIAGGTYTTEEISDLNLSCIGVNDYPDGGAVPIANKPNSILSIERYVVPITASAAGWTYDLPYGDRVYNKIIIGQRDSVTLDELANTVITDSAKLGLKVNNVDFFPDVLNADIQAQNKLAYNQATWPNGLTVLDFGLSGKKSEMLNTLGASTGKVTLKADVTAVSNGTLYIYVVSFKDIPVAAQRQNSEYGA